MVEKKIYLEVEVFANSRIKDIESFDAGYVETLAAQHKKFKLGRWQRLKEHLLK